MAFCKMGSMVQDHTEDGWIWVCRPKLFRHSCPFGSHKGQMVFLLGPILRYPHIHLGMSYQLQDAPKVTSVFTLLWGSNKYRQTECVLGIVREGFVWLQIQTKYIRDHMGKDIYIQCNYHQLPMAWFFRYCCRFIHKIREQKGLFSQHVRPTDYESMPNRSMELTVVPTE